MCNVTSEGIVGPCNETIWPLWNVENFKTSMQGEKKNIQMVTSVLDVSLFRGYDEKIWWTYRQTMQKWSLSVHLLSKQHTPIVKAWQTAGWKDRWWKSVTSAADAKTSHQNNVENKLYYVCSLVESNAVPWISHLGVIRSIQFNKVVNVDVMRKCLTKE